MDSIELQDWLDTTDAKSIQLKMEITGEPGYFDQEVQQVDFDNPDGGWEIQSTIMLIGGKGSGNAKG